MQRVDLSIKRYITCLPSRLKSALETGAHHLIDLLVSPTLGVTRYDLDTPLPLLHQTWSWKFLKKLGDMLWVFHLLSMYLCIHRCCSSVSHKTNNDIDRGYVLDQFKPLRKLKKATRAQRNILRSADASPLFTCLNS